MGGDVSSPGWNVPARLFECEHEVKKSRFIARVVGVSDRSEVNEAVAQSRLDYPDAGHHCWAYLLGRPNDASSAGMSDDGEPGGTAGKPILNVLQHGEIGDVLVVVIRYFGGVKLGAGGLVRAYGTAASRALERAPIERRRELTQYRVSGPFSAEQALRHFVSGCGGELVAVHYGADIQCDLLIEVDSLGELENYCAARSLRIEQLE